MKSKEKKKVIIKNENAVAIIAIFLIIYAVVLYYCITFRQVSYATAEPRTFQVSSAKEINLDEIIMQNTNENVREELVTEEVELEYITIYKNNSSLPKGLTQVIQEGRNGTQKITIKKIYDEDQIISEEQVANTITKAYVNKIIEVGTANYSSYYKPSIGDTFYVTSDRLSVMSENNNESTKIATLNKDDSVRLTEISGLWYKISGQGVNGWVLSEALTYIKPNSTAEEIESTSGGISKSVALSNLSFSMSLNKPSGLSIDQFKKVLDDDKDKNNVFKNNAEYFYYAEKQYNVNGIFIAAVGIHESGWGTSTISKNKFNLFGYGAYDSNPYNGAYSFSNYSESIDLIARVFVKYYINPAGTSIYGGEKASGKYYNGNTLTGVNKKYATDKNWANAVYNYIKYLYNKL